MELGWKGKGGRFDMLPLVLSGPDGAPVWFEIPEDITMIIKIKHPNYPAIGNLGLQWYGLPAVSGMLLEMGGVQFPACPFSGWYATSEVATRDLLDLQRYNLMQVCRISQIFSIKLIFISSGNRDCTRLGHFESCQYVEGEGQHRVDDCRPGQLQGGRGRHGRSFYIGK